MNETNTNEGDGSWRDRSAGSDDRGVTDRTVLGGQTRRGYLQSTLGAGAVAAGVGLAFGPGVASGAEVTDASLELLSTDPEGDLFINKATVSDEAGVVTVSGTILTANPCDLIELGDVRVASNSLVVPVDARVDPAADCQSSLTAYPYEVSASLSEPVASVVVEHDPVVDWTWRSEHAWKDVLETAESGILRATDVTSSSISLSWDTRTSLGQGVGTYDLQVFWTDVATGVTTTDTSVTLDGSREHLTIDPATTYRIQARGYDSVSESTGWTDELTVTTYPEVTDDAVLPVPVEPTVDSIGPTTVDLSWSLIEPKATGWTATLDHVNVYVNGQLDHEVSDGSTATTVEGLAPRSSYTITIRGADAGGKEARGARVAVNTPSAASSPPPIDGTVPRDLDGDGTFEDLNGNNRTDNDDVVTYFEYMDDPEMANNTAAYDYNGNDRIDFDDVVTLFESL